MLLAWIGAAVIAAVELPMGTAPPPVPFEHFPDRMHAFIWRNWQLVPPERMAETLGAKPEDILRIGHAMGLSGPPPISEEQWQRSFITIIRRNWHLLLYDQMLTLLGWTPEKLAFTLREDDFLLIKLGSLKPQCDPIRFAPPDAAAVEREKQIAAILKEEFPAGVGGFEEPLFQFVADLSTDNPHPPAPSPNTGRGGAAGLSPRFCHSYFALYGDPLLDTSLDPYPDGYLDRLAASGVDGVWLPAVLFQLAPFPWDGRLSEGYEKRQANLGALAARARKHGIGVYLYLNEPRAMPLAWFDSHPELKGVTEGDHAALCTSVPAVHDWLRDAVAELCRAVPDLAGFFTITASENLTNCFSHFGSKDCPHCAQRTAEEAIPELLGAYAEGIRLGGSKAELIAWDWGWREDWDPELINHLPQGVGLMSVSEWSIPIQRGGVSSVIGEYSISTIGPGPRATHHWQLARDHGLKTLAKIQAGVTWELGAVPYIPAVANVAQHIANLRSAHVDGLMLGWTLGGYPSPNLEVVAAMEGGTGGDEGPTPDEAMKAVALRRYGSAMADAVVKFWKDFSAAFSEFPFDGSLIYNAPIQMGPANLLFERPTGYAATMVGIPYDDLPAWRGVYPEEVFIGQFQKMAEGIDSAIRDLNKSLTAQAVTPQDHQAVEREKGVAEACALHYQSAANQARFVAERRALAAAGSDQETQARKEALSAILQSEIDLAHRLYTIQTQDSRIGFEATNQYFYVPSDLAEKVLNCRDLLARMTAPPQPGSRR
jgi:hypothetical protein